jgi:hypothetical protein
MRRLWVSAPPSKELDLGGDRRLDLLVERSIAWVTQNLDRQFTSYSRRQAIVYFSWLALITVAAER